MQSGELPGTVKVPGRAVRFKARKVLRGPSLLPFPQRSRQMLLVWWGGGLEWEEGETRKSYTPLRGRIGASFPLLWYSSSQSPIWVGWALPGAPVQRQSHTSTGRHRLKPNLSIHRPLTPRCSLLSVFCRAFPVLLRSQGLEVGWGGVLAVPKRGGSSPLSTSTFAIRLFARVLPSSGVAGCQE